MRYQKSFKELFLYCDRAIFELDVQSDEVTLLAGPCSEMQSWKILATNCICPDEAIVFSAANGFAANLGKLGLTC